MSRNYPQSHVAMGLIRLFLEAVKLSTKKEERVHITTFVNDVIFDVWCNNSMRKTANLGVKTYFVVVQKQMSSQFLLSCAT